MPGAKMREGEPVQLGPLWYVLVGCGAGTEAHLSADHALLTPVEQERAARFADPQSALRFVRCRAALRRHVGGRLGVLPTHLEIGTGRYGAPLVEGGSHAIWVSVSHSGGLGAVAWSEVGPCGVDLEVVRPLPQWRALARRTLTRPQIEALEALPEADQARGFLQAWTELEAQAKATGEGVFRWLHRTKQGDGGASESLNQGLHQGLKGEEGGWLRRLSLPAGYVGTVAAVGAIGSHSTDATL
jgi:4'-phosphopantetheinyl transferase